MIKDPGKCNLHFPPLLTLQRSEENICPLLIEMPFKYCGCESPTVLTLSEKLCTPIYEFHPRNIIIHYRTSPGGKDKKEEDTAPLKNKRRRPDEEALTNIQRLSWKNQ